ncbi:allantoate amidohydrolase [Thermomonospora umbrina]|uniref:N-carbamoyl-L-amino-acid hydrolase n=1 Tax=Thermomonospora umbrina TaxID=111806 RepID=A0A3D9T515_9ACTN|nr:allantoate amidohydrolase [Thermomonospora umbrina]REE98901.1 N-carbamoyl-L-amino-acid hydrolase [Thermomonospora umbrina]
MSFEEMWAALLPVGRDGGSGGYHRFAWTPPELECRDWFLGEARRRGLDVEHDGNGNLFAWWNPAGAQGPAVVTGSHLDSVPGGGAFDGPLGVVSALAAIDLLRDEGFRPGRPVGVAVFAEEEGARFGVACLGSRLLTGAIDPERARGLRDADGLSFAEVVAAHGLDERQPVGPDEGLLARIGCFVELHVEQGRALDGPVGVASAIIPHGRWRMRFTGEGDHAGTTGLSDRRDPMLPFAHAVLAARDSAARHDGVATVGKVGVVPGGVNAIPSSVTAWLDARGPTDDAVRRTVGETVEAARRAAVEHGVDVEVTEESYSAVVAFDHSLRDRIATTLGGVPVLPTGAGHDAGILSARVPAAMLFVRNPTGVSHAPAEHAEIGDCLAGVEALASVLKNLTGG